MLEKSGHTLCRQATTERVDEIVVVKLALKFAVRDDGVSCVRIKPRDLSLQKAYAAVKHRLT